MYCMLDVELATRSRSPRHTYSYRLRRTCKMKAGATYQLTGQYVSERQLLKYCDKQLWWKLCDHRGLGEEDLQ